MPGSCYSCKHFKVVVLFFSFAAILTHAYINFRPTFRSPDEFYPMVQFDRSGFTKAEILTSSYHAIQFLSKLNRAESEDRPGRSVPFMKNVLSVDDRKTRRQLLALEALGLSNEKDFHILSNLGFTVSGNSSSLASKEYLQFSPEIVGLRNPDYGKLCLDSAFTMAKPHRPVDASFCRRLRKLGQAIVDGREPPLLTLFTWWVDPISDGEILSRKAMMANWDTLRPFVIPVVFTSSRMNMGFANGHGWPCFPVTSANKDGLPVFEPLTRTVYQKFASSFYGYAKPIAMFDSSLLETLLAIKDSQRAHDTDINPGKSVPASHGHQDNPPILIHGSSIKIQQKFPDHFVNFERLYKYLRANFADRRVLTVEESNYVIFKDVDFTPMPPLVVHDNFLFHFLVDFSLRHDHMVINASSTLLAVQTFRSDHTNEWGRRYLQNKRSDPLYNKRYVMAWYNKNKQQAGVSQGRSSHE